MGPLLALFVTFGLMWVLLILPQQRRVRAQQAVVASLRVGDEVITAAGIYGVIVSDDEEVLGIEVAPGVVLRVLRGAISQRVGPLDEDDDADDTRPQLGSTGSDDDT
jgi:preprotein translocase subunit YajC